LLFSSSSSRSKTTDDLATSFGRSPCLGKESILNLDEFHGCGAGFVIIRHVIDQRPFSVVYLKNFGLVLFALEPRRV